MSHRAKSGGKKSLPVLGSERAALEEEATAHAVSSRRKFLQGALTAGAAAGVAASTGCAPGTWESFVQDHYQRLTPEALAAILERLERDALVEHGVRVDIEAPEPIPGVEFAYALNLSACTGCRQCEYACAAENNTSRNPQLHYIRVLEFDAGSFDLEEAEHNYTGEVPRPGKIYMPVSCQHCENPPCVRACPVNATWREDDGIVVIDYDWCIGCRYCEAACPYGARHFNFAEPSIPPSEINPDQSYLSNRVRSVGVMEKCHFCLHRTRRGELPACQEACPVGARTFGNILDPESEVRQILETKQVYILKEELGTRPRFLYYFG